MGGLGFVMAAAAALGWAAFAGGAALANRRTAAHLRERGLGADATVIDVKHRDVYVGAVSSITVLTVAFTDAQGRPVRASYIDNGRGGGEREGQSIRIVYDPDEPTSFSPAGSDFRAFETLILWVGMATGLVAFGYFTYRVVG
jgi:hypothetical protein